MENYYLNSIENLRNKKLIFFGTGGVGQSFYKKYCVDNNILPKPSYWCDNNKAKHNISIDNIKVITPEMLKLIFSKEYAVIITAGVSHMLQILPQLQFMGLYGYDIYSSQHVDAYFYFNQNRNKLNEVMDLFYDEKSKYIYKKFIDNLIKGRPVAFDLFEPNQYFDNDVIPYLRDNEVIVDAGVCEGEEIDKALSMNAKIKIHAFEPNRNSMINLKEKYKNDGRVLLYENALWNKNENLNFDMSTIISGTRVINNNQDNTLAIKAISLDETFQNEVTFIKMDIEGAEYNALLGAEKLIKKDHPKLAICSYHKVEDYIELPLLIKSMCKEYKLYFRQHSVSLDESVVYAL